MASYERFEAWKLCHRLTLETYRLTAGFPKSEMYGLTSQSRRAAVSVGANFVEGAAKRGSREFRRYLDISLGSLAELGYLLRCGKDLGFLAEDQWVRLEDLRDHAGVMVWKLYRSMGVRS